MGVNNRTASGAMLRDVDIRSSLEEWLVRLHAGDDSKIIHELAIPRPSGRVDLAVINGRLAGFEIKSDVDGLGRLTRQSACFSQVFEQMSLVVTKRHIKAAQDRVPDWWGLIEPYGQTFRVRRKPRLNKSLNIEKVLHILLRKELVAVERLLSTKPSPSAALKTSIVGSLLANHSKRKLLVAVREVLKER